MLNVQRDMPAELTRQKKQAPAPQYPWGMLPFSFPCPLAHTVFISTLDSSLFGHSCYDKWCFPESLVGNSQPHQENRNAKPEIEHSKRNRMKAFVKSYQGDQNRHSSSAAVASEQETAVIEQSTIQYAKEKEGRERSSTDCQSSNSIAKLGDQVMKDTWKEAYQELCKENENLVESYERALLADFSNEQDSPNEKRTDRSERIQNLVMRRLQAVKEGQFDVPIRTRQGVIGTHVCRTVQGIVIAKDFIAAAVSSESHAALAWAGAMTVLPVSTCPFLSFFPMFSLNSHENIVYLEAFTQAEDAVKRLDFISTLLVRYRVMQESHIQLYTAASNTR